MKQDAKDEQPIKFAWLDAVCSPDGPESPTMRLCLVVLARYMDADGENAYPSTKRLATETALGLRTVQKNLREAEELGWIERQARGGGQGWRRYAYTPTLPPKRAAGDAAPSPERAATDDITCGNRVPNVRQELPLSLSLDSRDTPERGAARGGWPARAAAAWEAALGGKPKGGPGHLGKVLKPLVEAHGVEEVLATWTRYLASENGTFASVEKFAERYGHWRDYRPKSPGFPVEYDPTDTWDSLGGEP